MTTPRTTAHRAFRHRFFRCPLDVALPAVLSLSVLLAGCQATLPKSLADLPLAGSLVTAPLSPTAPLPPPAARVWPDTAQDVLNQRARAFGLVNAPELQRYLNGLYARIKTQAGVPGWPGGIHLLASDAMQAYATGAGNIYVSLPWINAAQSEDEIVALLSHEFGHIYLHYHELEGAVADANQAAEWLALGVGIAKKTAQATGWNDVDTLVTVYTIGRGLATTVYSRTQESAADNFGLNVSVKMGYSYEHGMKAFLERLASWEEQNEARQAAQEKQTLQAVREQALRTTAAQNPKPNNAMSQSLQQSQGEMNAGVAAAFQQFSFDFGKAAKKIGNDHPETVERIDSLTALVAPIPELQKPKEPVLAPFDQARKERRTAALLASYDLAFEVIKSPKDPKALAQARKATTGATATHAVPLFALYNAMSEQPAPTRGARPDAGLVLEANFRSEPDRSWKLYQERSSRLQDARQTAAAKKVMEQGLAYFDKAEEPWPEAIRFYGETQGWDDAKKLAQNCSKNFRSMATRCLQAAASPAELAEVARKSKEKADQIGKQLFRQ